MKSSSNLRRKAKAALRAQFAGPTDDKGYVRSPQENLVPGLRLEQFEDDLRQGDGDELRMKFCAVHSSAALAVNCFAPFKDSPCNLGLFEQAGALRVSLEKKLRIFKGGRAPNVDVWIERDRSAVAIESKLLEYLEPKKPNHRPFSLAYERLAPPLSEPCWWAVYQEAKQGKVLHLDRAQLVKNYFALRKFQKATESPLQLTLLYIFWEPMNGRDIDACNQHQQEVKALAAAVSTSVISFEWMTYSQLWEKWSVVPPLKKHAQNLKERYGVCL